jgi:predicted ferric reductase
VDRARKGSGAVPHHAPELGATMLWTLFLILLVLWLLGLVSGYTIGGLIHILLVVAIIVVLIRVIQGRRTVI